MKISTVTCPNCKDEIFSRAHYDFRYCECGEISVDGGRDYLKLGYKKERPIIQEREINFTEKELYDDWNKKIDKLGIYVSDL